MKRLFPIPQLYRAIFGLGGTFAYIPIALVRLLLSELEEPPVACGCCGDAASAFGFAGSGRWRLCTISFATSPIIKICTADIIRITARLPM